MDYAYSIIMFVFAAGLLIYAGILAALKDPMLIPKHYAVKKTRTSKMYVAQIAKIVAVCAAAPALSGLAGLIWNAQTTLLPAFIVLILAFIICIYIGVRIMKKYTEGTKNDRRHRHEK